MSDETYDSAEFDEQLPDVPEAAPEPEVPEEFQNFTVIGAKATMVFKQNPRKGIEMILASDTHPGTRNIFKRLPYPTADESAVASDESGMKGFEVYADISDPAQQKKAIQGARMRVQEWKALESKFDLPTGLSLNGVAAGLKDKKVRLLAKRGKDYVDKITGEPRQGQIEVSLFAKEKVA